MVEKYEVSGSELVTYREVYDLINTDGGPGIEAIELQEVLQASGVIRTMEQVVESLREIGGEDLCIDFGEFIEFLETSGPPKVKKATLPSMPIKGISKGMGMSRLPSIGKFGRTTPTSPRTSATNEEQPAPKAVVGIDTDGDGCIDEKEHTELTATWIGYELW